jgi:hypothetical protein
MTTLAFTAYANEREVRALADGRLAERSYNARKGQWGWLIYSANLVRERWLSERQMARAA